ncbi:hypothetical protein EJB05_28022, partial [Eragrostis curvula]
TEISPTRNEENDWCRFRPSEESVSSSDSEGEHFMCLMAKGKKKPIKKDESESEDDDLEFNKLSKKDMYKIMKLMKKIEEQELQLEKQEEFLIEKMEELEALSENHEKLHNLHISLTNDYDNLKKDYACATNSSLCVASLQQENCNLKAQLGVLTSKQVTLQKSHEELLCSHENLIEAHALLEISHEVVLTMVKSYQPHTCNCTSTQTSIDLPCANICCSQVKPSCDEHIIVETCDDFIASENDNLVREVEKLKNELRVLRGKGHVQPSQDNRDDMVKKLEKGSTVTCTKSPSNKLKKIHDKSDKQMFKKKPQVMYLECSSIGHFASKCPSKKIDQTSLSRRQRRLSQRKCFGCMEQGHKIASCPKKGKGVLTSQNRMFRFDKPEVPVSVEKPQVIERCGKGFVSAYDRYMGKCGSTRRQIKDKERRIKYQICYTCRTKGHIGKDCPKAQVSIPKLVNIDSLAMKVTNDPCANMVICSPSGSTKLIWVPKSCVTNIEGPNKMFYEDSLTYGECSSKLNGYETPVKPQNPRGSMADDGREMRKKARHDDPNPRVGRKQTAACTKNLPRGTMEIADVVKEEVEETSSDDMGEDEYIPSPQHQTGGHSKGKSAAGIGSGNGTAGGNNSESSEEDEEDEEGEIFDVEEPVPAGNANYGAAKFHIPANPHWRAKVSYKGKSEAVREMRTVDPRQLQKEASDYRFHTYF